MTTTDSILRTIAYFDVFCYPLTAGEIHGFMGQTITPASLNIELGSLVAGKRIFQLDAFYSLQNNKALVQRRLEGNARAEKLLRIGYRIGQSLYQYPFVRGVGISGSLSKNYADEDADIDFFIITSAHKLWIARTFLHGLKKLSFLVGKQDWYCMNYFVSEDALTIAEKNIFTATEIVTLKPVCGAAGIGSFYKANTWAMDHFPNHTALHFTENENKVPVVKKVIEKIFSNRLGSWLDDCLMRITARRWTQKEEKHKLNAKGNPLGLIAGKQFARPNPEHFQKKILTLLETKVTHAQG